MSIIRHFQQIIQIPHNLLKWLAHQIQRSVRKNYRIFLKFTIVTLGNGGVFELGGGFVDVVVVVSWDGGGDASRG